MIISRNHPGIRQALVTCGIVVFLMTPNSWSKESVMGKAGNPGPLILELEVGKSRVIDSPVRIRRTSVANPQIADTLILTPTQIYVVGKSVGETNITLWASEEEVLEIYELRVVPGLSRLKEQLYQLLKEGDIQVSSSHDYISLSGIVSSATNLSHALALAEAYAPKKVINLLKVGGVQQVMLKVRIAEMNRTLVRRLGINFLIIQGNNLGVSQINNLTRTPFNDILGTPSSPGQSTLIGSAINALFSFQTGSLDITGFIDALKGHSVLKILAEPNLVTLSGQEASFLAGGEVPIQVQAGLGTTSIVFKQFGVAVTFKPTVLGPGRISLHVTPEFSEIDTSREAVQGVPSFLTRRVSTVIELADGQSFAIGGLIQDNVRENIAKYPFLGDLPILGALFRSSRFQKDETELIIIVTPHLVKPLDVANLPLPTSGFIEPDDFSFYLLGQLEQSKSGDINTQSASPLSTTTAVSMLDGKFGHLVPVGGGP